ncbi:MAG TPA: DUF1343 domain-containing protein [Longimicrobiales bacterium]|nr:DUF1343 domain-containing protein [Longimicrobiales bacterium]
MTPAGKTEVTGAAATRQRASILIAIAASGLCACAPAPEPSPAADAAESGAVLTGLDVVLRDDGGPLAGKRVGLITNHTGIDRNGDFGVDLLHAAPELELVALFSPEHSITGAVDAGESVDSGVYGDTGIPIHSLYGEIRKPTPEMLEGIDVLAFDIQDIGTRYYTYVWTMALAMQAAAENDIEFVVLDRPNPIGGELFHGNIQDSTQLTFVGLYPVPMRHGFTPGELAAYLNSEHGIGARLTVVQLENWNRSEWFDDTGLPWLAPSPNMPSVESATHYAGTCLFEGTNVSVGRGTDAAFAQIGAPWIDADSLSARLARYNLPGVRFEPVTFTPAAPGDRKFADTPVHGVRLVTTDRTVHDPARAGIAALVEIHSMYGDTLTFRNAHFDRLAGTTRVRTMIEEGASLDEITATWPSQLSSFAAVRGRYLLYP